MARQFEKKIFIFNCYFCGAVTEVVQTSKVKAAVVAHKKGWRSTSIGSPTAKYACEQCAAKPITKKDFMQSIWVLFDLVTLQRDSNTKRVKVGKWK